MTTIIAMSGKKSSGKNTAVNFIVGLHLVALGIVKNKFTLTEKGELYVSDVFGDETFEGIFDVMRSTPAMNTFLQDHLNAYLKIYSFADLLKTEICMKILGLTYEQCYGSDDQKNTPTHLKWEDMPTITNKSGFMTGREVMQYVGTNLFRKMYNNVWVDATIRRIQDENSTTALITDCRFPNEVKGVQDAGGKVMRLTRNPFGNADKHFSEIALDENVFDWGKFDAVIDNNTSSILEQNKLIYAQLKKWKLLPIELENME